MTRGPELRPSARASLAEDVAGGLGCSGVAWNRDRERAVREDASPRWGWQRAASRRGRRPAGERSRSRLFLRCSIPSQVLRQSAIERDPRIEP
jgi:hypothetical protein